MAPKNAAEPLVAWSVSFYWSCTRFLTIFAKYICHRFLWYTHLKFFLTIYIISNYNYLRRWGHDYRLLNNDWLLLIHWLLILDLITLHLLLLILYWLLILNRLWLRIRKLRICCLSLIIRLWILLLHLSLRLNLIHIFILIYYLIFNNRHFSLLIIYYDIF